MNIEVNFNKHYIGFVDNVINTLEQADDLTDFETRCLDAFRGSYAEWYDEFLQNQCSLKAASCFYLAVGDCYEQIVNCDEQMFVIQPDFFASAFRADGISAMEFYDMFDDGVDAASDAKSNLWEALNNLYRLSTVLCVYQKMPIVKQILDHLAAQSPDISQTNIAQRVMTAFNTDRKMRRLFMKLMNETTEKDFMDIFASLQRVVSALAGKIDVGAYHVRAREALFEQFKQQSAHVECEELRAEFDALLEGKAADPALREVFESKEFEPHLEQFRKAGHLGNTMRDMLAACKNKDQESMNNIFQSNFDCELPVTTELTAFMMKVDEAELDVSEDTQRELFAKFKAGEEVDLTDEVTQKLHALFLQE